MTEERLIDWIEQSERMSWIQTYDQQEAMSEGPTQRQDALIELSSALSEP